MSTKPLVQPRPERASRRAAHRAVDVYINLAFVELKALMIEQSHVDGSYLTVYQGARADFVAAGVPADVLPAEGEERSFRFRTTHACCTGSQETLRATARSEAEGIELEVSWGGVCPYVQGGHPALVELARCLSIELTRWSGRRYGEADDLEAPFRVLAADPRAVDYKPAGNAPRYRVTPEFLDVLGGIAHQVYQLVQTHSEIVRVDEPAAAPEPARLCLVNGGTRSAGSAHPTKGA